MASTKPLDLKGQRFGKLVVLEKAENQHGRTAWLCQCDCGNKKIIITPSLRSGNTKSCGCLHKETASKNFRKDIANQRFGNLIAIKPTSERKHGSIVWECLCDCGNKHFTTAELLLSGHTKSCGCIRSRGNQKIKQILLENNISFKAEFPIRLDNINYYYDFAIMQNNQVVCLIEYDGILHYQQDNYHGWNNRENWERTQNNDIIKNKYAETNCIPLIRIPYFDYDKLNYQYIKERIEKLCIVDILPD